MLNPEPFDYRLLARTFPALYQQSVDLQTALYDVGVAWHNTAFDECCPGFECCNPHLASDFLVIPK